MRHVLRLLLSPLLPVGLVSTVQAAEDAGGPPPGAWVFEALGGATLSEKIGDPGEARGGVKIHYEGLALAADQLIYQMMLWPGSKITVVRTVDLTSAAGADDRITIDTRNAIAPTMGFRGALYPRTAHVQVIDPDPATPLKVRYRVDLAKVGAFRGLLKDAQTQTWIPHQGWADTAELWFEAKADAAEGGLKDIRLAVVVLHCESSAVGAPAGKRVELDRWKGPDAPPEGAWPKTGIAGHVDCRMLKITLAEDGAAGISGNDLRTWGTMLPAKRP